MREKHDRLLHECAVDDHCVYIPGRRQHLHYKVIRNCSVATCDAMISRGWRRFGETFFRPICEGCDACRSLRIDASTYAFSRSERRVLKKNRDLLMVMRRPGITRRHLDIFERYHNYMHDKRGWSLYDVTPDTYAASFISGANDYGFEVLYFEEKRLIGVDLIDILPSGISSIYFYYDPGDAHRSLGKFSLLQQIQLAKRKGLRWIYLGYCVDGCQSLMYKRDYHELWELEGRPENTERAAWRKV